MIINRQLLSFFIFITILLNKYIILN